MMSKMRWRIEGVLTTTSPLHIGSGDTVTRDRIKDGETQIDAVLVDHNGKPYVPGTTVKGNIRNWLERHAEDEYSELLQYTFGTESYPDNSGMGGNAEFWNAYIVKAPSFSHEPPYWDTSRLTGVEVSTAVDRHTRTVTHGKLFYQEYVPAGASFKVIITGQFCSDDELVLLLFALEKGFNADSPITFGGSASDGWGRFRWTLSDIKAIDSEGVQAWLAAGASSVGYDALVSLPSTEREALRTKAEALSGTLRDSRVTIEVNLFFDSLFLVNDPSQVRKDDDNSADKTSDQMPMKNQDGKAVLPASSFRGAFRSQAERIIRTLGVHACDTKDPCPAIMSIDKKDDLCSACRIFGASGWKATVEVSDFVQINTKVEFTQEFVAIDRFTGGAAEGAKFQADAIYKPVLKGTIAIDVCRIRQADIGLLALAFRDLLEGDITFGFGASKGYGSCSAVIENVKIPREAAEWLAAFCTDVTPEEIQSWTAPPYNEKIFDILNVWVQEFRAEHCQEVAND